jgi:hypothetical protein
MTPSEIKPAPFRLLAQCFNQLRHRMPPLKYHVLFKKTCISCHSIRTLRRIHVTGFTCEQPPTRTSPSWHANSRLASQGIRRNFEAQILIIVFTTSRHRSLSEPGTPVDPTQCVPYGSTLLLLSYLRLFYRMISFFRPSN